MEYFTFKKVNFNDHELMDQIYRLRFEVYCNECHFISQEDYPEQREKDIYDPQSLHFAAINSENEVIGTMRMILPGEHKLPIETHCSDVSIDPKKIQQQQCVEISRLVISRKLRRRKGDELYYSPDSADTAVMKEGVEFLRRHRPMAFGLYREIYHESKRRGIQEWYSLMEKSLWLLLRIHGFHFECVGKQVDVYGPVNPYIGKIHLIEQEVQQKFPKFFEYFAQNLETQYLKEFRI
ncbi:MAG: PEP-CTERM/exosortase system-associated acyltransferase [Candidatus Omnitrophica bacterium]|nr:PEP-CTERM/exosortase system-associated acyltransferase [Candidatus Omnitrophota bacterium]